MMKAFLSSLAVLSLFGLMIGLTGCDTGGGTVHPIGTITGEPVPHPIAVTFRSLTGHYIGTSAQEDGTLGNVLVDVVEEGDAFHGRLLGTNTDGSVATVANFTGTIHRTQADQVAHDILTVTIDFEACDACSVTGTFTRTDEDHVHLHGIVNPILENGCVHRGTATVNLERVSHDTTDLLNVATAGLVGDYSGTIALIDDVEGSFTEGLSFTIQSGDPRAIGELVIDVTGTRVVDHVFITNTISHLVVTGTHVTFDMVPTSVSSDRFFIPPHCVQHGDFTVTETTLDGTFIGTNCVPFFNDSTVSMARHPLCTNPR